MSSTVSLSHSSSAISSSVTPVPKRVTNVELVPSKESKEPFPKIGSDVALRILSYLSYEGLNSFSITCKRAYSLRDRDNFKLERDLFRTIKIFDREQWKNWKIEITDEYDADKIDSRILRDFLTSYYGKDPLGGPGRVCDNCLVPTVVPSGGWCKIKSGYVYLNLNLDILGKMAEDPISGRAAKYSYDTEALKQHRMTPVEAGAKGLWIKLKGVIGRNKAWSNESENPNNRGQVQILNDLRDRTGWGCLPEAFPQNTILFAHYALTGKRPHGDNTGMEGQWTSGRTIELVQIKQNAYPMVSSGFREVEGAAPAELDVDDDSFADEDDGVGVQRRFC